MLGEEAASTIGINTFRCRLVYLLVLSVLTGALVSVCGTIGFVGSSSRMFPAPLPAQPTENYCRLRHYPADCSCSVDAIARSLIPNTELPVGIFTAWWVRRSSSM